MLQRASHILSHLVVVLLQYAVVVVVQRRIARSKHITMSSIFAVYSSLT